MVYSNEQLAIYDSVRMHVPIGVFKSQLDPALGKIYYHARTDGRARRFNKPFSEMAGSWGNLIIDWEIAI